MALRCSAVFCSSSPLLQCRSVRSLDEGSSANATSRRIFQSGCFNIARKGFQKDYSDLVPRKFLKKNRTLATAEHIDSASDPVKQNGRSRYHPFEDIGKSALEKVGDARLPPAETCRTIVEVNSKGTLMLTGLIGDTVHENLLWPDLPYTTDQNGNIYFQVKNNEDILPNINSENNYVQVIIGFDTLEMIKEMELSGPSDIDFGFEEIDDEESDMEDEDEEDGDEDDDDDDEDDEDWVAVLEDDDDEDGEDSDESLGDWANLETMRSSHPMYFAKKMAQVASDDPVDWMEQPSAGLAIQGLLRPVIVEEHSDTQRLITHQNTQSTDEKDSENIVEQKLEDVETDADDSNESDSSDDSSKTGTSFYKLEIVNIQLITAQGDQTDVEVEDYLKAQPDAIAHASSKIITRLEGRGEIMTQALKSLCWRCKGIQAEEVKLIEIDSLGFDVRVCSGTQIQTLRFGFPARAISDYGAEKQLNEILFPKIDSKPPKQKQSRQKEC